MFIGCSPEQKELEYDDRQQSIDDAGDLFRSPDHAQLSFSTTAELPQQLRLIVQQ
ncbi:hypothetical protein RE6C_02813 [Rhodopirellula europaea 6C]|uniref:Uncharacterized protein n=1 Tax=Rhodopirellula europaea 6C TaxID=1263867 RepID=M2B3X8_9BACT|nr:hypothetical protein RE6C_02813 [Rhodopirellula europaea 6C]